MYLQPTGTSTNSIHVVCIVIHIYVLSPCSRYRRSNREMTTYPQAAYHVSGARMMAPPKPEPHYCSPAEFRSCYQAILSTQENPYALSMELRPLPTLPPDLYRPVTQVSLPPVLPSDEPEPETPAYSFSTFRPVSPPADSHYNCSECRTHSVGGTNLSGSRSPLHHYFELEPEHELCQLEPPRRESGRSRKSRHNSDRDRPRNARRQASFHGTSSPMVLNVNSLNSEDADIHWNIQTDSKFSWP